MIKSIPWKQILQVLVEDHTLLGSLEEVLQAILKGGSARWSNIARHMRGSEGAAYKRLQRFIARFDPRPVLRRLCPDEASMVILDPTPIPRPQAKKTAYGGRLPQGERGYWLLVLGAPFRGRFLPCGYLTYSSKTINDEATSQNLEVQRLLDELKGLLRGRPLVADRGFHDRKFFRWLMAHELPFIVRVRMRPHPLKLVDGTGERIRPFLRPGEGDVWAEIWHEDLGPLTLIGYWKKGFREPLWLLTTWHDPEEALRMYFKRMRIEEGFRDFKTLLGLTQNMNRQRLWMERTLGLVLLVYVVAYLAGEALRDALWGGGLPENVEDWRPPTETRRAWHRYSGLFALLRLRPSVPPPARRTRRRFLLALFPLTLHHPLVQTHV